MTLSGGPSCEGCNEVAGAADFVDEDDMKADGVARKGRRAVVGLADGVR